MIPDTAQLRDALAAKLADLGAWAGTLTREQIAQELARVVLPEHTGAGTPGVHQDGAAEDQAAQQTGAGQAAAGAAAAVTAAQARKDPPP